MAPMFRDHLLMKTGFRGLWRAQAVAHPAADKRAVLVAPPASKRSSVNLSLMNDATSASHIRRVIGSSKDVTAQLTALQKLAKLMQQQQGQAVIDQAEYQQRLQLANRLLSQLAQSVSKMTAGSICRLCFILSRLQASEVNIAPLRQAAARQLLQQQRPTCRTAAAAAANTSTQSGTAAKAAASTSDASTTAAAAAGARSAAGSSSAADTAAAAAAAASWSGDLTPGDLLYLLRALHTWQGDDCDHDEINLVLLPAAVAAAAAHAQKFSLQELIMVVSILAKMRYYSADLMNMAAARSIAAAAQSSGSAAAATQNSDQQQQQHKQISDDVDPITDQIFVTYLWSNASLAHVDQQQLLLPAAVRLLLSSDSNLVQCSQYRSSNDSSAPTVSDHKRFSMPLVPPLLLHLNPKYLPMCAWSLAVMLICILARQTDEAAAADSAAAAGVGCSSTAAIQMSDPTVTAAAATPDLQRCEQLVSLVAATVTLCELLAAAAAGGSSSTGTSRSRKVLDQNGLYDREGLAQLHHARILATAAAAAVGSRQQQQLADQQSSSAICSDSSSGSSSSDLFELRRDNAQCTDLLQVVNAHIQQQQRITNADQLASFRAACKQAWGFERPNTSHTQQQVYEELQRLGFSPHLELPALTAVDLLGQLPKPQALSTPLRSNSASVTAHTYNTQVHTDRTRALGNKHLTWELKQVIGTDDQEMYGNGLHIDIVCMVPHTLAEQTQQQGLFTVLQQIRSSGRRCIASSGRANENDTSGSWPAAGSSSGSSSWTSSSSPDVGSTVGISSSCGPVDSSINSNSSGTSGNWPDVGTTSSSNLVVLAVEVDGPSHVAANDTSHLLGNTVCRNWLLQQLGYVVVMVAWWEWDDYCALSTTLTGAAQRDEQQ